MIRKIGGAATLALALALGVPSIAGAETIGSITPPTGSSTNPASPAQGTYVQTSSASFSTAVSAGGGRITQWSTNTAGSTAGASVQLVVLRPIAGSANYTVIAVDSETLPNPLPASQVATFTLATPISVIGGDKIGINSPTSNAVGFWSGGTTPATDVLGVFSTASPSAPAPGQTVQSFGAADARVNVAAVVDTNLDAGVTTSTAPARPTVGNLAELHSIVSNNSAGGAPITFTDTVPAGLAINSVFAGGNGSCNTSGQTVTCTIPSVPGHGSVAVDVLVTPKETGSYVNQVSVSLTGGLTDPVASNNQATARLKVRNTTPTACTVPNLRGTPAGVAAHVLKLLGCKVAVKRASGSGVPRGAVLKTTPKPGTYKLHRKVTLIVKR